MLPNNLDQNQSIKILYIEDNASFANLVRIFLEEESYNVYSFITKETLAEGLEVLTNDDNITVTLLDLNLPDSSGLETLETTHKKFPTQNIIVLTGEDDEKLGLKAVQSGAQDYLVKGQFDNRALVKSIQYAIERSAAANRLAEAQRIAKIGNWISIPESKYFYLSPVSYKLFGLDYTKCDYSFEEMNQPDHPFYPLLELEDEVVNRRKLRKELSIKWTNGVTRHLSVLCELSLSASGNYIFNGVLQDITEQKRAEELRKARDVAKQDTKFREKVFADLSQEISNPIRGILGVSQLFEEKNLSNNQQEYVRTIKKAARFIDKTIAQFIEKGMILSPEIQKEYFFLHDLLGDIQSVYAPVLEKKNGGFNIEITPKINWSICLPKNLFKQVLLIIVKHACDQADHQVEIKVDLIEEQARIAKIQLLISDDGTTHQGQLIFEDTTKPELNIAKTILANFGGHIGYYDNPKNKGSIFFIELVVEKGSPIKKQVPVGTNTHPNTNNQVELLIIERNRMNQILLKSSIERHLDKVHLHIASNANDALKIAKQEPINLVLLDMEGEKKDIFDITSYFAALEEEIPVLALSSVDYTNHQNDLRNYGLDDFILKPYDPEQLIERISFYTNMIS